MRIASVTALTLIAACASSSDERTLTVLAAASLTEALERIALDFEAASVAVRVRTSFAGSQMLATQIENGARADVFASANPEHIDRLRRKGLVHAQRIFAVNALAVVVPTGNPAGIEVFDDLPKARRIVIAGSTVPLGRYTEQVLEQRNRTGQASFRSAVMARVVSRENDVRATLQKVLLGEADAAVVYASDAHRVQHQVRVIEIPSSLNVRARYTVAVLRDSAAPDLAERFTAWLSSENAASRLAEHGFLAPSFGKN
ncbi:MAG: molybdate ABC transporter substrate-binding protein [Myxococcota bacterium]